MKSCGISVTLFFTIVMTVTSSLSFCNQENTLKIWSKNVDRLEYLEHTLCTLALILCLFALPQ